MSWLANCSLYSASPRLSSQFPTSSTPQNLIMRPGEKKEVSLRRLQCPKFETEVQATYFMDAANIKTFFYPWHHKTSQLTNWFMSKIKPLWLDFLFLLTNVSAILSYWTNYRMEQIRGNYQPEGADPTFVISGFLDFSSPENENLLRPLAEDCLSTWNTQIEFHGKY